MRSHKYDDNCSATSSYPSYPPAAPSASFRNHPASMRRLSVDSNRPPSHSGSSRSPYNESHRSPLQLHPPQHAHSDSGSYEERDLGEIAAANQAAQERTWGPHATLSEVPARYELYADQLGYVDHLQSTPATPGGYRSAHYEPAYYDGGVYMEYVPQYHGPPSQGAPTTVSGRSHQSLPAYASPASEPPNMFDVTAAHHLPGSRALPQNSFGPGARVGDPLPGFPQWSQTWYGGHLSADGHAYTMVPPGSGQSGWESESLSHGRYGPPGPVGAYGAYPYGRAIPNDYVKEERMRMLEKEFGTKVTPRKGKGKAAGDEDLHDDDAEREEVPLGSVDAKGRLVLPRRKLRMATRWLQCLVSLAAAGLGIGGFILIRPAQKAPPSGTFASFVLYGVSAISTIACLWLFALKPCCRSSREPMPKGGPGAGNGMVIPILSAGNAGGNGKPGMFAKKAQTQQAPMVNLIVDPKLLGGRAGESDTDTDDDDEENTSVEERRRKKRKDKKRKQLGVLANMKQQARWRIARKSLKWDCGWDVVLCLLWGTAAVMALVVGTKCPAGTGEGWCNLYNGAIACSVVATLLFLVAIYCDVVGLRGSKAPPGGRV
ncbi:hypothetical protein PHSY_004739 [Pseudozyma hubeiensis SY62]|uniref:Uncharacterized protein n=1 Tax=Pseudozyma hubeiensis (strain SY62) TaxID=1305764 RepID=R9P735_PSEHS|nr:hypothetical protein PHSY_004739 [Pseudozyma hubeiensis SY62]GAC97154.1 hypothetical protein PHSY_004739 [Pseudozyma hubeiensis SY62]